MTEHLSRKENSLKNREKQSAVSNYMSQIVGSEVGQEQEREHLNMTQSSSTSVGQDRRNQQQWSHRPEKEARIHHNMTNVGVISAPVKPDEPAPHGWNNAGKASNHERINDQCKTSNKTINYDNQRDLSMQFYETRRCYNQSEMNLMPVYQRGDSVWNQQLTPPLPVVYSPQRLIIIPFFSGFFMSFLISANMVMWTLWMQMSACKYTWNCTATFINKCFLYCEWHQIQIEKAYLLLM